MAPFVATKYRYLLLEVKAAAQLHFSVKINTGSYLDGITAARRNVPITATASNPRNNGSTCK